MLAEGRFVGIFLCSPSFRATFMRPEEEGERTEVPLPGQGRGKGWTRLSGQGASELSRNRSPRQSRADPVLLAQSPICTPNVHTRTKHTLVINPRKGREEAWDHSPTIFLSV